MTLGTALILLLCILAALVAALALLLDACFKIIRDRHIAGMARARKAK